MKNILIIFVFTFANIRVSVSQSLDNGHLTISKKDTAYWEQRDKKCSLIILRGDNSREEVMARSSSCGNHVLSDVKFSQNSCGVLSRTGIGYQYVLSVKKDNKWGIVALQSWNIYLSGVNPTDVAQISLFDINKVSIRYKTGADMELIAFDNDGKITITKKKE